MSTYENALSDDEIRAMGLDPEDVRRGAEIHAQRTATQQEDAEAREIFQHALVARDSGEFTDAQIADALAQANPAAHQARPSQSRRQTH